MRLSALAEAFERMSAMGSRVRRAEAIAALLQQAGAGERAAIVYLLQAQLRSAYEGVEMDERRSGSLGGTESPVGDDGAKVQVGSDEADVSVALEDPEARAGNSFRHVGRLLQRRHQMIAVGGEEQRGRFHVAEARAQVILLQDAEPADVAIARGIAGLAQESLKLRTMGVP